MLLNIGREKINFRNPILEISNIHGIVEATQNSVGISSLPSWMESFINLEEILSELKGPKLNISLCYKYHLKDDQRLKAFKKFLIDEIGQLKT